MLFFGALVAVLPFVLPLILRRLWRLESLDEGEERDRIQAMIARMGVNVSDICLWRTGHRCLNAAVAGAFRRSRILLISDALIDSFDEADLDAVVAHEMAHIKHRHVPTMLMSLVAAGLTAIMCSQIVSRSDWQTVPSEQTSLLILFPILVFWLLIHRFVSRSFEHQADLEACLNLPVADDSSSVTESIQPRRSTSSAVGSFVQMLRKLAPAGTSGSDWWHPSIETRIEALHKIHHDAECRLSFDERITAINRMVHGSVIFLALVTAGLGLLSL